MRMETYVPLTWEDNETFLHDVRVVRPKFSRPTGQAPVKSTPYPRGENDDRSSSSMTTQPPSPETPALRTEREFHLHVYQGYLPATPIQRFNNKSLNWPAWFRHFRALLMSTVGQRNRERYNWCLTSTRPPWMWHRNWGTTTYTTTTY